MEEDRDEKSAQLKDLNRSLDEVGSDSGSRNSLAFVVLAIAIVAFMVVVMLL